MKIKEWLKRHDTWETFELLGWAVFAAIYVIEALLFGVSVMCGLALGTIRITLDVMIFTALTIFVRRRLWKWVGDKF